MSVQYLYMKKSFFILFLLLALSGILFYWFSTPNRYLLESNAHLSSGKIAKAVRVLEKGVEVHPKNHKINFALAKSYFLLGEIELANKAILSKDTIPLLKDNKLLQDFLVDLAIANLNVGNKSLTRFFAQKYMVSQNKEEVSKRAAKNYVSIGRILPEYSLVLWEKAYNIAYELKDTELKEGIKALLLPEYFHIAESLSNEKKYIEALDILKKARTIGRNAELNFQEGIVYGKLDKIGLAQRHFEEAISLDPDNVNYKLTYANVLKDAAIASKNQNNKTEYLEKVKLLLSSIEDNPKKTTLLNKILYLNKKYKISDANLMLAMIGDYSYPSLAFKIKPVSDTVLEKYKIIFLEKDKKWVDVYEADINNSDLDQIIEVTSRNPVNDTAYINAKLYLNNEFVSEYTNKRN